MRYQAVSEFLTLTNKWILGSVISLLAAFLAYVLSFTNTFENLELKSYDLRFVLRGVQPVDETGIAIVAIDELSFLDLPDAWPFPRSYYAKLIDNLTRAGAKLIVFDVTFTEPSIDNPEYDFALARAAARAQRVLFAGKLGLERTNNGSLISYPIKPIPPLLEAGVDWALVNIDEDADGFVRRYLLYEAIDERKYLPLALRAYLYLSDDDIELDHAMTNGGLFLNGKEPPKFDANSFLINFRGPARTFPTYSLSSVLDDSNFDLADEALDTDSFETQLLPAGIFKNKVVLVGASAEELQDNKFTPFFSHDGEKRKLPGVEIHANALSTLLRRDFIRLTPFELDFVLIILVAFGTMALVLLTNAYASITGTILEIVVLFIVAVVLFSSGLMWLPVMAPAIAILLSYAGNSAQVIVLETRERRRTKRVFEQYVSESVVNSILASGSMPKFGGEKLTLTVLFSDIRSFTTYCEKHAPETVVHRLNEYLTRMVETIFRNQGTLDKFVGDEIMALLHAPYYFANHWEKACRTACEMISSLRELQKQWSANAEDYFQIGIGINTGTMIVGNLGAQQRFDYTVIGDEVNLGARLEGANKQYWTSIIISESTYRHVKRIARARELDLVRVKGKSKPVKIYELRSMEPLPDIEEDLIISVYHQGLRFYKQRQWYRALREFKRTLRYFPSDGPSRVYVARCLNFIEEPPPPNWDGVYEFKTK